MALDRPKLQEKILEALEASSKINVDTDSSSDNANQANKARKDTAEALAKAIEAFVKSGTVTTKVTTTGSASAQTGTGTGSIS
jgi:hypothetical protein